ncbi:hypothetical protein BTN49_2359 [Candidatus Enterovibrio escicola]|uniref:Uncharacterized protein n=1 Tax=Candidatus Enterovibrio escicola TaxID=1927127 RepID=A0A2A5T159_9GAMM|nr:hypothetical protein BTN49_2359 [Candidatus Enterovibrio escacola]
MAIKIMKITGNKSDWILHLFHVQKVNNALFHISLHQVITHFN